MSYYEKSDRAIPTRYVAGVSWPRSGHHLLVRLCQAYFGRSFGYCEHYKPTDCCHCFPCLRRERISFSKNHDFRLTLKPTNVPVLVQYRELPGAAVSDFELAVRDGAETDDPEAFEAYARNHATRHAAFIGKWVVGPTLGERLLMDYAHLTGAPEVALGEAIAYMAPGHRVDRERLRAAIEGIAKETFEAGEKVRVPNAGVSNIRDLTTFRFYDARFFAELETLSPIPELPWRREPVLA